MVSAGGLGKTWDEQLRKAACDNKLGSSCVTQNPFRRISHLLQNVFSTPHGDLGMHIEKEELRPDGKMAQIISKLYNKLSNALCLLTISVGGCNVSEKD